MKPGELGLVLFVIGFTLAFVGGLMMAFASATSLPGQPQTGGCIGIFPFVYCWGSGGPGGWAMLAVALIMTLFVVALLLFLVPLILWRPQGQAQGGQAP
ncbi:MAG: hypothetical protein ABWK00_04090 [Desulfurococcaceae archaeon]